MRIEIRPDGLALLIEEPPEWMPVMNIVRDVDQSMAGELGELMAEDDLWAEVVVPELDEFYNGQLAVVQKAIAAARKETEGGEGEVFIRKEDAEAWYGTLNQAQHALEKKYGFEARSELDLSEFSLDQHGAYFRRRFYGMIQQLILENFWP